MEFNARSHGNVFCATTVRCDKKLHVLLTNVQMCIANKVTLASTQAANSLTCLRRHTSPRSGCSTQSSGPRVSTAGQDIISMWGNGCSGQQWHRLGSLPNPIDSKRKTGWKWYHCSIWSLLTSQDTRSHEFQQIQYICAPSGRFCDRLWMILSLSSTAMTSVHVSAATRTVGASAGCCCVRRLYRVRTVSSAGRSATRNI